MAKNLFDSKDIRKLTNFYKKFVKLTSKKKSKEFQKIDPSFFGSQNTKEFKYPIFPEKGLNNILEIALSATLKKEEGRHHHFSISVAPVADGVRRDINPNITSQPFIFAKPLEFNPDNIKKLSTALNGTDNNIKVVFNKEYIPQIIGFSDEWDTSLIIESLDVGKLLFSVLFIGKISIAIIESRKIKFIQSTNHLAHSLYQFALYNSSLFDSFESENAIQEAMGDYDYVIKGMNSHGHGGTLIFVSDENWKKSVQQPINFFPRTKFCEITKWAVRRSEYWENFQDKKEAPVENWTASERTEKSLKLLSQITALDGATIVTKEFEILAFGAKLKTLNTRRKPNEVILLEPFEDSVERFVVFEDIGGTRHQSTVQFIFDQRNAVAIVASQDGKVSVMFWDIEVEKVRIIQHIEYFLA